MPDRNVWPTTWWACVCGREHAPWWRTTPAPSCPYGFPRELLDTIGAGIGRPSELQAFTFETVMSALSGPLP